MNLFHLGHLALLAARHRRLALQKLHERSRIGKVSTGAYWNDNGGVPPPLTIGVNLTFKCNLRCKMCGQYGERGVLRGVEAEFRKQHLSIRELQSIIDEISPYNPDVFVWGGEPLLHPEFVDFIRYVKARGLICTVNTNGTLLKRCATALVEAGLDGIDLSLDGPAELNDEIRGIPGATMAAVEGARAVAQAKSMRGTNSPMIKAVCTISEANVSRIEELVDLVAGEGVFELLCLQLGWFTTEEIGECHEKVFQKLFSLKASSWGGFVEACGKVDPELVKGLMAWCRSRRSAPPIVFFPDVGPADLAAYYCRPEKPIGKNRCMAPWLAADIRPNGDVTFCPDFPDYVVGNVRDERFMDIWRGPRADVFRKTLRRKRLFPICSRCCGLYAYGVNA